MTLDEHKISIQERLSVALSDGETTYKDTSCHLDKIVALGLVARTSPIADAIFRLKYSDQGNYFKEALTYLIVITQTLNARYSWKKAEKQLESLARDVLVYWLFDVCMACEGRGLKKILGTPTLSNEPCEQCNGTTKRAYPWDNSMSQYKAVLCELEKIEREAGAEIIKRLANEVKSL